MACTEHSKYYYYLLYGHCQLLKMRYFVDNSNCVQKKIVFCQVINYNSLSCAGTIELIQYYWRHVFIFLFGVYLLLLLFGQRCIVTAEKKFFPSFTCIKSTPSFHWFCIITPDCCMVYILWLLVGSDL